MDEKHKLSLDELVELAGRLSNTEQEVAPPPPPPTLARPTPILREAPAIGSLKTPELEAESVAVEPKGEIEELRAAIRTAGRVPTTPVGDAPIPLGPLIRLAKVLEVGLLLILISIFALVGVQIMQEMAVDITMRGGMQPRQQDRESSDTGSADLEGHQQDAMTLEEQNVYGTQLLAWAEDELRAELENMTAEERVAYWIGTSK